MKIQRLFDFVAGTRAKSQDVDDELNQVVQIINANDDELITHKGSSDHDGRYYTETEIETKLTDIKGTGRTTETIKGNADNLNTHKSSGDHDGRYYTETEINTKLATKTDKTGNHEGTWQGYTPNLVGDAILSQRIQVLEDEYNSPEFSDTLIQNSSIFTTGTGKNAIGTDIDVSASVVEGQISDIWVKGKTVSNVFKDGIFDSLTGLNQSGGLLIALDTVNKLFGTNGLKMTLSASTSSYAFKELLSVMDKTKYYCISGYLKNGNATNVKLYFNPVGQSIRTGLGISDTTKFTRDFIKIQPTDFNNATMLRVGAYVTGADTQYAYLDGVMVYEITQAQYNDSNFSPIPFINGTKSTVNSKVRSVSSDGLEESVTEINWTDDEGRSLPNGTYDEIKEGKEYKKTKKDSITTYASLDTITYTNVDVVKTSVFSSAKAGTTAKDGITRYLDKTGVELTELAQADINLTASVGKYYYHTDKTVWIIVSKGAYADLTTAQAGLGTTSLIYQLANEAVTDAQGLVPITAFPDGDMYIEPQTEGAETTVPTFEYKVPLNRAGQIDSNTAGIRQNAEEILRIYARLEVAGI